MPEIHKIIEVSEQVRLALIEANAQVTKLKEQKAILDQAALAHLAATNTTGIDTKTRKWFKKKQTNYTIDDAEAVYKFILEHKAPEMLQKRINTSEVKAYAEAHGALPSGVSSFTKEVFTSRAK